MSIVLKNNASDFLAAAIDSSQTSITLESGASFPTLGAGEYFYGTIESTEGTREIVRVNARVGNTLTVVRGQDGTSAVSFAQGSRFESRINVASVEDFVEDFVVPYVDENAELAQYNQGAGSAVTRTIQNKLQEAVSVKDLGATGDGVTNDTAAIQAALDIGGHIIFPFGEYLCDSVFVNTDTNIDFQGSTVKRFTNLSGNIFKVNTGNLTMVNGVIDGNNQAANRGMLLHYNDPSGVLILENMVFQNNCRFDGPDDPTKGQDTDLVYAENAGQIYVDRCIFNLASRQGISVVSPTKEIKVSNSVFEDCYLFGIDIEPNTSTTFMYDNVLIDGNTFLNCGSKSATNRVWNAGNGPFALSSPGNSTVLIARNVVFSNNKVVSTDFLTPTAEIEPLIRVNQFKSLTFTGNAIDNIDLFQFCTFQAVDSEYATVSNNVFNSSGMNVGVFFTSRLKNLSLVGNNLRLVFIQCPEAIIADNVFSNQLTIQSSNDRSVITGNTFVSAINNTEKTDNLIISNNKRVGGGEIYSTALNTTNSIAVGNSDGDVFGRNRVTSYVTEISVPTGTATNILALENTNKVGFIAITDPAGTRLGAYGSFANFNDLGANNSTFLTGVQNSGVSGSSLDLAGNTIQFTHTFGSTRTLRLSVLFFL